MFGSVCSIHTVALVVAEALPAQVAAPHGAVAIAGTAR